MKKALLGMSHAHTAESRYYTLSRPEMLAFLPSRRARLLEIGCGQGLFASTVDGVAEAWGVEPTAAADAASSAAHRDPWNL